MSTRKSIEYTRNYDKFVVHEQNRPIGPRPVLEESLKRHGFLPSSPIHCVQNGDGKLKVIRGHHRLFYATKHNTGVWYIIDNTCSDIYDLEGGTGGGWSTKEFAISRAGAGNLDCQALLAFQQKHQIPLTAAAALVAGEGATSNNRFRLLKTGAFRVGDMWLANAVAELVGVCRKAGVQFAAASGFIGALSLVCQIEEFDDVRFAEKVQKFPAMMRRRSRAEDYLEEIESVYNHASRSKTPLKFLAQEAARERQRTFGRKGKRKSPKQNGTA